LWHDVRIEVPDEAVEHAVRLVAQSATHPFEPRATIELTVLERDCDDHYMLLDRGDRVTALRSPREVLDATFQRVHRRAFELASLLGWVRFHGAVARIGSTRLVLAGRSSSGKTTLAAAILASGGVVEADESFLTRDGRVVAVPRRWHVRPPTIDLLPRAAWMLDAPLLPAEPPLRMVDPTEHGFEWSLEDGPVDGVVVLMAGEDLHAAVGDLKGPEVARALIDESFPVTEPRAAVVRHASALALRSPGYALRGHAPSPIEMVPILAALGRSH
jgi:hypothetical protein